MKIEFFVHGKPRPQPRPRMAKNGHVYNPPSADEWKNAVAVRARAEMKNLQLDGPVKLDLLFWMGGGKNKKQGQPHTIKPDKDNLEKAVMDALTTAGVWIDDCQVYHGNQQKIWGEPAGAFISIEEVEE